MVSSMMIVVLGFVGWQRATLLFEEEDIQVCQPRQCQRGLAWRRSGSLMVCSDCASVHPSPSPFAFISLAVVFAAVPVGTERELCASKKNQFMKTPKRSAGASIDS